MEDSWMVFFNLLCSQYCDWRCIPESIPLSSPKLLDLYRGVKKCQTIKWQSTVKGKGNEMYCSISLQLFTFPTYWDKGCGEKNISEHEDIRTIVIIMIIMKINMSLSHLFKLSTINRISLGIFPPDLYAFLNCCLLNSVLRVACPLPFVCLFVCFGFMALRA